MTLNPALMWAPVTAQEALTPEPPPDIIPEPRLRWIGTPHFTSGRGGATVCAIVVHTMAGSLAGSYAWLNNPASRVSYHFGIGLGGQQHQYVTLTNVAWANGILEPGDRWPCGRTSINAQTVAIGTEDLGRGDTPVSDAQWQATLEVANLARRTFRDIRFVVGHDTISPRSRPQCPGQRWRNSGRLRQLAERLGLTLI